MSTTEGRRERMQRILKILHQSKKSLTPNEIAQKTEVLTEITMDRLFKYLAELEWSGIIIKQGNRYTILPESFMKIERERERRRIKERETEKKVEVRSKK
jgi:predicted transcriptional regulator